MTTDAQLNPDRCQRERLPAKRDELSPLTSNPPAIRMGQLGGPGDLPFVLRQNFDLNYNPQRVPVCIHHKNGCHRKKSSLFPLVLAPRRTKKPSGTNNHKSFTVKHLFNIYSPSRQRRVEPIFGD